MTPIILLTSLILAGYVALYLIMCAVAPWGPCRACHGTRRSRTITRRDCRRCDGTGRRVRAGRRLYDYFRSEYKAGTR